jgi:hypothetical protein
MFSWDTKYQLRKGVRPEHKLATISEGLTMSWEMRYLSMQSCMLYKRSAGVTMWR